MALPSIVAWSETSYSARTNSSIAVPPGLKAGSLVLVYAYILTTRVAITPPAGFTEVTWSTTPSVGNYNMRAFWKIATTAETGTYTFTHVNASIKLWAYEVDNASGIETANSVATSTTTSATTPAVSLTTTGADRLLIHWGLGGGNSGGFTASTGFSEWWDWGGWFAAAKGQAAAGATGAVAATGSTTSALASLLAVIPANSLAVSDTFTGTNGTVPANWTVGGDSGVTGTIQSNKFRITVPGTTLFGGNATRSTPTVDNDLNLSCSYQFLPNPSANVSAYIYLHLVGGFNTANPWQPVTSGYALAMTTIANSPARTFTLYRYSGGAGTNLGGAYFPESFGFPGVSRIRFQAIRSLGIIRARYWQDGQPEPADWHFTYNDSTPLPVGKVGLAFVNTYGSTYGAQSVDFDDVVINSQIEPVAPSRVIERWNGTASVPQRVERWSGTGLTVRKVEN